MTKRWAWVAVWGALLCAPFRVWAGEVSGETGLLATAQTATGVSANMVVIQNGPVALYIDYTIAAGTATIQLEQQVLPTTAFRVVTGSSQTTPITLKIEDPAGEYQSNVTACAGCNVTVGYRMVFQRPRY